MSNKIQLFLPLRYFVFLLTVNIRVTLYVSRLIRRDLEIKDYVNL
jgi:hypothetical protein